MAASGIAYQEWRIRNGASGMAAKEMNRLFGVRLWLAPVAVTARRRTTAIASPASIDSECDDGHDDAQRDQFLKSYWHVRRPSSYLTTQLVNQQRAEVAKPGHVTPGE